MITKTNLNSSELSEWVRYKDT